MTVVITDNPLAPEIVPSPGVLESVTAGEPLTDSAYRWQPAKAPHGPVTIVVSGRDQRIVILRNGVEIGSSAITIDGPVTTTEAFTLGAIDPSGVHWLRLPLPGQRSDGASEMTLAERGRVHFPEALRQNIVSIIGPGTTLLVTRDSLKSAGTGTRLTVIATDVK